MTRTNSLLLACLALSVACAGKNKGSENPDAGEYDEYYSETGDAATGSETASADGGTTAGPRPQARVSTATRSGSGAVRKGKAISLVAKKPAVSGGDKPREPRTMRAEFAVDGVFPTTASVGSTIEIFGSGFPEDMAQNKVFVGGKELTVIEAAPDRILARVDSAASGAVEVGKGTRRINKRGRAKTDAKFIAVEADGAFGQPRTAPGHGLLGRVFAVDEGASEVPNFNDLGAPLALYAADDLDIPAGEAQAGVAGVAQSFGIHFQGSLNIVEAGEYELCLAAGDGALLFLDQTPIIDNDGSGATREVCETLYVEPGEYGMDLLYYQGADTEAGLTLSWAKDGGAKEPVPATAFFPPENLYDLVVEFDNASAGG